MKAKELILKNDTELNQMLINSKKELLNLRFQKVSLELKNPSRFKVVKKQIARIYTILNNNKMEKKNA